MECGKGSKSFKDTAKMVQILTFYCGSDLFLPVVNQAYLVGILGCRLIMSVFALPHTYLSLKFITLFDYYSIWLIDNSVHFH